MTTPITTLTVRELIEQLSEMPQDWKVYSWANDKRIPVSEVVNVGDVVDLYNYEPEDEDFALVAEYEEAQHALELEDFDQFNRDNTDPLARINGQTDRL
jgi:hypothetical protein